MSTSSSRRGFFARLFGAAAAGAAASAGPAADPPPARCPHYVDGTFWVRKYATGADYGRHPAGCPFCGGPQYPPLQATDSYATGPEPSYSSSYYESFSCTAPPAPPARPSDAAPPG